MERKFTQQWEEGGMQLKYEETDNPIRDAGLAVLAIAGLLGVLVQLLSALSQ